MKAKNTELLRLARLVQKDIASGRVSDNARLAVAALADYQNPVIDLLELALTQKSRSLVDALAYLFCNALEALRFDIEAGYKTASELAESVRRRLMLQQVLQKPILKLSCFLSNVWVRQKSILAKVCAPWSSS